MTKGRGKGISFSISVGCYAGFQLQLSTEVWRLVIGFVAISLHWYDLDFVVGYLLDIFDGVVYHEAEE